MQSKQSNQNQKWLPVLLIAGALAIWGGLLALGAYWAPSGQEAGADPRKLMVVAVTTGGFLLFWALALAVRSAKVRKQSRRQESDGESQP